MHIENEHSDRFEVHHDRCRSFVIGDQPLSWSGHLHWFANKGINHFRMDFTVRAYAIDAIQSTVEAMMSDSHLADSHSENLERVLL